MRKFIYTIKDFMLLFNCNYLSDGEMQIAQCMDVILCVLQLHIAAVYR